MAKIHIEDIDLYKIVDALKESHGFLKARDDMNARVHLAREVRYSPLTVTVENALERANSILDTKDATDNYLPVEIPDIDPEVLRLFTEAMRAADDSFAQLGGGTRHFIRDCLWPEMQRRGLAICHSEVGSSASPIAS